MSIYHFAGWLFVAYISEWILKLSSLFQNDSIRWFILSEGWRCSRMRGWLVLQWWLHSDWINPRFVKITTFIRDPAVLSVEREVHLEIRHPPLIVHIAFHLHPLSQLSQRATLWAFPFFCFRKKLSYMHVTRHSRSHTDADIMRRNKLSFQLEFSALIQSNSNSGPGRNAINNFH